MMHAEWKGFRVSRVNLQFAINDHGALGEFHHWTLQLHDDVFDGGTAVGLLSSYLDVEVLVSAPARGGQHVVAGGVQLENIPIKGLEVEVAPCTANLAIVDGTHACKDRSGHFMQIFTDINECSLTYLHKEIVSLQLLPTTNKLTCYFFRNLGPGGERVHRRLCLCWKK